MGMFKPDLYRAFAIGFLIGCAGLAANFAGEANAKTPPAIEQVR